MFLGLKRPIRTLNQALYWVQLGLRIELPEDRLCPPVRLSLDP